MKRARRRRTPSPSPTSSTASSRSAHSAQLYSPGPSRVRSHAHEHDPPFSSPLHPIKHARTAADPADPSNDPGSAYTCALPPTCAAEPLVFPDAGAWERHHARMHVWVCKGEVRPAPGEGGVRVPTRESDGGPAPGGPPRSGTEANEGDGMQDGAGGEPMKVEHVEQVLGAGGADTGRKTCGRLFPDERLLELVRPVMGRTLAGLAR